MRTDPLVLFCSPRGGSSLVAGVFARHGFWTGKTFGGPDGVGSGGYVNHENAAIKEWMKERFPLNPAGNHDQPNASHYDLRAFCETVVPPDTLWMFKGPSEYYNVFNYWFPKMIPVMVFRDRTQAIEAHVRRRGEKVRKIATEVVDARYSFMYDVLDRNPRAHKVDAELVVDGYLYQIEDVLVDHYGIELSRQQAMTGISPERFHR